MSIKKWTIDDLIACSILLGVLVPFERIILPFVGSINLSAWLFLITLMLTALKVVVSGVKVNNSIPFVFFVLILLFAILRAVISGTNLNLIIEHVITYRFIFLALLLLAVGLKVDFDKYIKSLVIVLGVSGAISVYVFYFSPDLIISAYEGHVYSDDVINTIAWGRNLWSQGLLVCFSIIYMFAVKEDNKKIYYMMLLFILSSVVALITSFSRTIFVAYVLFFILAFVLKKNRGNLLLTVVVFIGGASLLGLVLAKYTDIGILFEGRIVNLVTLSGDYSTSINPRLELYQNYLDNAVKSPIFGNGLGEFYSDVDGREMFWSDITLVSLFLPFGVFGLLFFVVFTFNLLNILKRRTVYQYHEYEVLLRVIIYMSLFISLNLDLWTHKYFVVVLVSLILSIESTNKRYLLIRR